ncbi:MAG: hypothetical protein KIT43_01135 [Bauldia sp.]|nr:hypothetical protein [Bauldia sp.]
MKRVLIAAALLATAAGSPAFAIDVVLVRDGPVYAIVGDPGPEIAMPAGAVVAIDTAAAAPEEILLHPEGDPDGTALQTADALVGLDVFTSDRTPLGAVVGFAVATDTDTLVIVELVEPWAERGPQIAIRASALRKTESGLLLVAEEGELRIDLDRAGQ